MAYLCLKEILDFILAILIVVALLIFGLYEEKPAQNELSTQQALEIE